MAIIVPNTASSLASSGCIPGTADKWVWVGLRTPITASGSVTWYRGASATSGCELIAIAASPAATLMFGPFNSPCPLSAQGVTGGCAVLWMKQ